MSVVLVILVVAAAGLAVVTFVLLRQRERLDAAQGLYQLTRAEIVDTDERLTNVLESVTDGFVTLDEDWRLTYVNRRAEQIFGRPRQRLLGRSGLDVFPEGVGSRIHQELDRARIEHTSIEFESWYSPGQRWFEVRAYPAADGGLTVYFRDVTRRKRAQEAVTLQARLLDAVGQAVVAVGNDGVVFYCNRAAEELFGWQGRDVLNKLDVAAMHPESSALRQELLHRIENGLGWSGELTLVRDDGTTFPAHLSDSPIVDDDGTLHGMVRIASDATARHADQRAQRLLAQAGAALASTLDYDHTVRTLVEFVVPELADCCFIDVCEPTGGARRIESAWSPVLSHGQPERLTRRSNDEDAVSSKLLRESEAVLISRVNGEVLNRLTTDPDELARLRSANVRYVIVAPLNVGGRKLGTLATVAVRRSYKNTDLELMNELARRAAFAIDNAMLYETASLANQSKSDFLAVMSHELRTPLTTVMGYTDLLLAGVTAQLTTQSQAYVERIRTAAWHLLGLIEQILIYARLEVGRERVHVEKVMLTRIVRDAAELIEPVASEKGLQFKLIEPDPAALVETDVTKLRQILLNLLSNAVKFTDSGIVELEARATESGVDFMVHDTGVGIAPEHQQRVFDSFWQVDQSATRKEGGTGIGLSVSRKLARLLGGDINVRSTPEEGTTFTLHLPHRLDERAGYVVESE
jgi:PAS domain S-box-containing protein